jgi:predicted unusual protein kinase regulating ubiquinone biosynthesis (AarF/ABC1/UbiB family)
VGIETLGEHIFYLNKDQLSDGFLQADAHPGNILFEEV